MIIELLDLKLYHIVTGILKILNIYAIAIQPETVEKFCFEQ